MAKEPRPQIIVISGKELGSQVPVRPHLRTKVKNVFAVSQKIKNEKERRRRAKEPPAEIKTVADKATTLADYLEAMDASIEEKA